LALYRRLLQQAWFLAIQVSELFVYNMETPGKPRQYKIHKLLLAVKQTDIVSLTTG